MQITKQTLRDIEHMIHEFTKSIPIFYSKMVPKYLFDVKNARSHVALKALRDANVLCVSAIGSVDAFIKTIEIVSYFVLYCSFMLSGFCNKDSFFC